MGLKSLFAKRLLERGLEGLPPALRTLVEGWDDAVDAEIAAHRFSDDFVSDLQDLAFFFSSGKAGATGAHRLSPGECDKGVQSLLQLLQSEFEGNAPTLERLLPRRKKSRKAALLYFAINVEEVKAVCLAIIDALSSQHSKIFGDKQDGVWQSRSLSQVVRAEDRISEKSDSVSSSKGLNSPPDSNVSDQWARASIADLVQALSARVEEVAREESLMESFFDAVAFARHAQTLGKKPDGLQLKDVNTWLREQAGKELLDEQKPAVAEAINYFRDHWSASLVYVEKGVETNCVLRAAAMNYGKGGTGMTFYVRETGAGGKHLSNRKVLPSMQLR
ncbi:hypothetical protein [Botrimarina hoheduenensis]|uniref:Uncharacterized protein n=1 Tax=Botrimarina hoheduenensis TaxID=2528000 RepID=A0A5C5VV32_9BACT|nr:hypothetical protein [Botrimarina hoheduenensis]TWT41382.1 hypothetical protein Pla111_30960 [Botrimarina hoheduenensis]